MLKKFRRKVADFWQRLLSFLAPAGCFVLLFVMIGFGERYHSEISSSGVDVRITPDEMEFMREDDVFSLVNEAGVASLSGLIINEIDMDRIEKNVNNHPYVEHARVFALLEGKMVIDVEQRTPFFRVINKNGESFYVDDKGGKMPVAGHYTFHSLVVRGNIDEEPGDTDTLATEFLEEIYYLVGKINEDPFMSNLAGEVYVNNNQELIVIPRVGDARIVLGDQSDLDEKFRKLQAFYRETLPREGWDKYSEINLSYKNQIIAKN